jgi:hypothetical protein
MLVIAGNLPRGGFARPGLRDPDPHNPPPSGHQPLPTAIALRGAGRDPLMASSADVLLSLGIDRHLQPGLQQLTHPLALISAAQPIWWLQSLTR